LKAVPLMSINSKVFVEAMIPAIEGFPLNTDRDSSDGAHRYAWDIFVRRILDLGYLLLGGVTDLNREENFWIVEWPKMASSLHQSSTISSMLGISGQSTKSFRLSFILKHLWQK
jgi:hypothetical protein